MTTGKLSRGKVAYSAVDFYFQNPLDFIELFAERKFSLGPLELKVQASCSVMLSSQMHESQADPLNRGCRLGSHMMHYICGLTRIPLQTRGVVHAPLQMKRRWEVDLLCTSRGDGEVDLLCK